MKIQYKAASIMALFGALIVLLLSYGFDRQNHRIAIDNELNNIKNLSNEVSLHLQSHLQEKTAVASTITTAPCLKEALRQSNNTFSSITDEQRNIQIANLNQRWRNTNNIDDPFIQAYLQNSVAMFLKEQQILMPGVYGELFLTNRYGVIIGTTGKLTTLAHAHKYWWLASYNDGKGRIFLDDRGFDESVDGYVLGVVIPVKDGDEIIGILKCNVNIAGPLTDSIEEYKQRNDGDLKIVRTGGLVVRELGATPLSTQIPESLHDELQEKRVSTIIIAENEENILVAMAPVQITMGSSEVGFGGSKESIDHIKGNTGEAWHIVIAVPEEIVREKADHATRIIVLAGVIFSILVSVLALFLGKLIAKPIVKLAHDATQIGAGNLKTRAKVSSNDEIGSLAKSLNSMACNLEKTIAEISTLRGIIPICCYCKKIRDDKGAWERIEAYICSHSDAQFSHGICPECHKKQVEDMEKEGI